MGAPPFPGQARALALLFAYLVAAAGTAAFVLLAGITPSRAAYPPPTGWAFPSTAIVISELRVQGPTGSDDEFIELYNLSPSPVDLGGWRINSSDNAGTITTRVVISPGTTIPAYGHFLATNAIGYSGSVPGDRTYSGSITGDSGIAILNASSMIIDQMGMSAGSAYGEGVRLVPHGPTVSYERKPGGPSGSWQDTDNNNDDFYANSFPDPQNLSSPPVPPATPTPTYTRTPLPPTHTPTITPTGPPTLTFTPTRTRTATVTFTPVPVSHTATPTISMTPTRTPTVLVQTPDVKLYMVYVNGYASPQTDEAVRLWNVGGAPANLANWQIANSSGGSITFPAGASIAAGQKLWIANQAASFRTYFGFNPDYEYGGNTDPTVPDLPAVGNVFFNDTNSSSGGFALLRDNMGAQVDSLAYGNYTSPLPGWAGSGLRTYTANGQFPNIGQILYRRLDQASGLPVADTGTAADWANDNASTNDDIDARKVLRPGWALTDPSTDEDMFFTKIYTQTGVTTRYLVAPDNIYDPVRDLVLSATTSITIEAYEWRAPFLITELIAAKNRGVNVSIVLDGNPCCSTPRRPDDATLYSAKQFHDAGIPVYFFSGDPSVPSDEYRYDNVHAKFMIVDDTWLATGSENFSYASMPPDNKANGTRGNRGAFLITNAPALVAYAKRLNALDFAPGKYPDIVQYPGLGTPSPSFTPTPFGDPTAYQVQKPTPLVVTETSTFEIIQSPDNALRSRDSLIGLVNSAGPGDTVMVEQQYERKYWDGSTLSGPNPRLEAYIAAAQRGANVRILLDDDNDCSATFNSATVDYALSFSLPNLQARIGRPTSDDIHNKMVLVQRAGVGIVHISSINGSQNSSKNNRELGIQVTSNAAFQYYGDIFEYDWARGYVSNCFPTPTATRTPTPVGSATATPTRTVTPTPGPTMVVLSEFRTRGPNGGNDEFIELYNATGSPIDIGGWKVNGSNGSGSVSTRFTIGAGTIIPAHGHFLAVNTSSPGYSGSVPGDITYTVGIADNGGIALLNAANVTMDQAGMSDGSAYGEGTRLPPVGQNDNFDRSYERLPGGSEGNGQDTDDNSTDFTLIEPSAPQNLSSPPVPPVFTPTVTRTPTISPTASATFTRTPTVTLTTSPTITQSATHTATPTATTAASLTRTPTRTATLTLTGTPTRTSTATPTETITPTGTPTATATPVTGDLLVGHVTWQGAPAQPHVRQQQPITLTLKLGSTEVNYPSVTTDSSGFFTVSVGGLPTGTYDWRAKGPKFLANAGSVLLSGGAQTNAELGLMRAGDANNSNNVNSLDFTILRSTFGTSNDLRADFNNDGIVNSGDFTLLRSNFGLGGPGPLRILDFGS